MNMIILLFYFCHHAHVEYIRQGAHEFDSTVAYRQEAGVCENARMADSSHTVFYHHRHHSLLIAPSFTSFIFSLLLFNKYSYAEFNSLHYNYTNIIIMIIIITKAIKNYGNLRHKQ